MVCVSITSVTSSSPIEMSNERLSRGCTPKTGSQTKVLQHNKSVILENYMYTCMTIVYYLVASSPGSVICSTVF